MPAVEAASTMERVSIWRAVESITSRSSTDRATPKTSASFKARTTVVARTANGTVTIVVAGAAIESRPAVSAVVPGASANKQPAGEPLRTVVAIGGAGVGGIVVIAVSASWSGATPGRADSNRNPEPNGLRLGGRRRH